MSENISVRSPQPPSDQEKGLQTSHSTVKHNYDKCIGQAKRKHPFHIVAQTRLEAYFDMRYSGELGKRQTQVFQGFRDFGDHTSLEMVELLHLPINTISGRINDLVQKFGLLEEKGEKWQHTGRRAIIWGLAQYHPPPNPFRDEPGYFTKSDLLRRGWTQGTIDQFLSEAEETEENPHTPFGAPMRLYRKAVVLAIEHKEEYRTTLKPKKPKRGART